MKVKLIDKKGFEKIISIAEIVQRVKVLTFDFKDVEFELFDIPKKGLPVYKEVVTFMYAKKKKTKK